MGNRNVTCNIRLFSAQIRKLRTAMIPALKKTADELHKDLRQSQKMPRLTGNLQGESTFVDCSELQRGKVYLVSDTPYARRLYFHPEYHFNQDKNPHAGGKWLEDYLPGGKKDNLAQDIFNVFYREEAGL